jgi:hypothetical protein
MAGKRVRTTLIVVGLGVATVLLATTSAYSVFDQGSETERARCCTYVFRGHAMDDRQARVRFDIRYDPDWTVREHGHRGFHTVLDFTARNVRFRCADGTAYRAEPQWDVDEAKIRILDSGQWAAYAEETRSRDAVLERYSLRGRVARSDSFPGETWKGWFRAAESKNGLGLAVDGCRTGRVEWRAKLRDQRLAAPNAAWRVSASMGRRY